MSEPALSLIEPIAFPPILTVERAAELLDLKPDALHIGTYPGRGAGSGLSSAEAGAR